MKHHTAIIHSEIIKHLFSFLINGFSIYITPFDLAQFCQHIPTNGLDDSRLGADCCVESPPKGTSPMNGFVGIGRLQWYPCITRCGKKLSHITQCHYLGNFLLRCCHRDMEDSRSWCIACCYLKLWRFWGPAGEVTTINMSFAIDQLLKDSNQICSVSSRNVRLDFLIFSCLE